MLHCTSGLFACFTTCVATKKKRKKTRARTNTHAAAISKKTEGNVKNQALLLVCFRVAPSSYRIIMSGLRCGLGRVCSKEEEKKRVLLKWSSWATSALAIYLLIFSALDAFLLSLGTREREEHTHAHTKQLAQDISSNYSDASVCLLFLSRFTAPTFEAIWLELGRGRSVSATWKKEAVVWSSIALVESLYSYSHLSLLPSRTVVTLAINNTTQTSMNDSTNREKRNKRKRER